MNDDVERLVADQIRYYDDRAPEYEELWYRRGRHDGGAEFNAAWFTETAIAESAVDAWATSGSVLEIGCGSGLWTRRLAPPAGRYVAVDASPRMLELNRARIGPSRVEYVLADAFAWSPGPGDRFDLVFLGFFLSHIPPRWFGRWWRRAETWLTPRGRVAFVDDAAGPDRPYSGDRPDRGPEYAHRRRLGDEEYTIVKVFYAPEELAAKLARLGWRADVRSTGIHLLYGTAAPERDAAG
jgi:SAM-dependent methyltransferase